MRLGRLLIVAPFVFLFGCPEAPECVDFNDDGEYTLDCSAGKVAVCGEDPELIYSSRTGALLPTPADEDRNGDGVFDLTDASCQGIDGPCRPRPICARLNDSFVPADVDPRAVCPDRLSPRCVLGAVNEIDPPRPMPDSGPPPEDAGPGEEDAGMDEDAGTDDAGTDDAGTDDAGTDDAGTADGGA